MNERRSVPAEQLNTPANKHSDTWTTARFERTVLVAARTLTITLWGLDFLDEVLADPRIQTLFSVDDQKPSHYWQSAANLLHRTEAATIPWSQATSMTLEPVAFVCPGWSWFWGLGESAEEVAAVGGPYEAFCGGRVAFVVDLEAAAVH